MKTQVTAILLATFVHLSGSALADKPMWPRQPKLSSAYKSLSIALRQIELRKGGDSGKHIGRASAALVSAKSDLETAKKNKGSARVEAIKQIEQAKLELDASRLDDASACISKALELVTRAAANGR